jgi:propionyl-CoA carboxylase alpha chain
MEVSVSAGQRVRAGDRLAVVEAMKMENILVAAEDGAIASVQAHKGENLAVDQVILHFE